MSVYDSIDEEQYKKLKAQGLKGAEIAREMGIPEGRLNNWLYMKKRKKPERRCKECIYRSPDMLRQGNCSYSDLTGHMRRSPADNCDKFIKGPRKEKKQWELFG